MAALPRLSPEGRERLMRIARGEADPDPVDWLWAAGAMHAPFNRRERVVPAEDRLWMGKDRATSLEWHLRKRQREGDLAPGVGPDDYERLCREVALNPGAALFAYTRVQGPVLAALVPTEWAVPEEWRGPKIGRYWLVVYSFWSGTLVTGYSVQDLSDLNMPWREVRWLRVPPHFSPP
ncbi:hypothetical protein EWH23_12150 [Meiothermus sp. PNK-Is4]|uniref:hypothetical protein n=1 Tax=Meiothermus sp. PNK-Is4 TaxID=2740565 RepID=UPI00101F8A1D|nr:hypothetical protein [Meiothermus sp. PNK-Is4]RYM35235.1 hypothetical protein EWH23_12150 [Meiothermus sp. PNK-Is4]